MTNTAAAHQPGHLELPGSRGAGALAVAITASLAALGGTAGEAYAVTPHSDGTVTVSLLKLSGATGANATLRKLGVRAVIEPVKAGCPSLDSFPLPPGPVIPSPVGEAAPNDSISLRPAAIPAGAVLVIAAEKLGPVLVMLSGLIAPPAPACISMPGLHMSSSGNWMYPRGHQSGGPAPRKTSAAG